MGVSFQTKNAPHRALADNEPKHTMRDIILPCFKCPIRDHYFLYLIPLSD